MIGTLLNYFNGTLFTSQTILLLLLVILLLYWIGSFNHDYFTRNGISGPKPVPFMGNSVKWHVGKASFFDVFQQLYQKYKGAKVFGLFDFMTPLFVVCDFELIKQICIKDFDSFTDRRFQFNEETDPIFSNALFALNGIRWKNMRAILSPAFTGSKMRAMFQLINDYCIETNETLNMMIGSNRCKEVELKDIFTKITSDIIASCAFGLEMNVLRDSDNEFFQQMKHLTHFTNWQWLKFVLSYSLPWLTKVFGLRIFDSESVDFMRNSIREIIQNREQNKIIRHDMVHLLMQARDKKLKFEDTDRDWNELGLDTSSDYKLEEIGKVPGTQFGIEADSNTYDVHSRKDGGVLEFEIRLGYWTLDDFVAQCTVFVFGGLDTISSIACFMAHELALNPGVQSTLREEIDQLLRVKSGTPIQYEDIQSLEYLDRVVTETLRKWPQALFIDRLCTKDYNLKVDDKLIPIKRGTAVWIPALPIQRDPRYFPDPGKFDPDRFSPERRDTLQDFVHLGFGIGPRSCLGNRFALLEIKTVFFWLLSKFEITRSAKTQDPLRLGKSLVVPVVEAGFFASLKKRYED